MTFNTKRALALSLALITSTQAFGMCRLRRVSSGLTGRTLPTTARVAQTLPRTSAILAQRQVLLQTTPMLLQANKLNLSQIRQAHNTSKPNNTNDSAHELASAVIRDDVITIKKLLESGVDINTRTPFGHTVLIEAAHRGQKDMIEYLVSIGANVNLTSKLGTALHASRVELASLYRDPTKFAEEIQRYAEINNILIKAGAIAKQPTKPNIFERIASNTVCGIAFFTEPIIEYFRRK